MKWGVNMGSINYHTSEYITLAIKPLEIDGVLQDPYFVEWADSIAQSWTSSATLEALAIDWIYNDYQDIYNTAKNIIDEYDFERYELHILPGYEEGYSINIECCLPGHFDTYKDKKEAQKEVTQVKECLIRLVKGAGFCECFPSWSTGYSDVKDTIKGINGAIKLMRKEIAITETERQLNKRKERFI